MSRVPSLQLARTRLHNVRDGAEEGQAEYPTIAVLPCIIKLLYYIADQ